MRVTMRVRILTSHQSKVAVTGPYTPWFWSHGATVARFSIGLGKDVVERKNVVDKEKQITAEIANQSSSLTVFDSGIYSIADLSILYQCWLIRRYLTNCTEPTEDHPKVINLVLLTSVSTNQLCIIAWKLRIKKTCLIPGFWRQSQRCGDWRNISKHRQRPNGFIHCSGVFGETCFKSIRSPWLPLSSEIGMSGSQPEAIQTPESVVRRRKRRPSCVWNFIIRSFRVAPTSSVLSGFSHN